MFLDCGVCGGERGEFLGEHPLSLLHHLATHFGQSLHEGLLHLGDLVVDDSVDASLAHADGGHGERVGLAFGVFALGFALFFFFFFALLFFFFALFFFFDGAVAVIIALLGVVFVVAVVAGQTPVVGLPFGYGINLIRRLLLALFFISLAVRADEKHLGFGDGDDLAGGDDFHLAGNSSHCSFVFGCLRSLYISIWSKSISIFSGVMTPHPENPHVESSPWKKLKWFFTIY